MEPLSALFDLPGGSFEGVIVAVATHIAGPLHPFGIESWDLTLHGEAFEALSSDPFSFAGEFFYQGLRGVRMHLLEPAGFVVRSPWLPACQGWLRPAVRSKSARRRARILRS